MAVNRFVLTVGLILGLTTTTGWTATCSEAEFSATIDKAGSDMRRFNQTASPKLKAKLNQLKKQKGWASGRANQKADAYLQDSRISDFDAKANRLLATIDTLSELQDGQQPDCTKLSQLKTTTAELQAVMKAKSAYLIRKIDAELTPQKTSNTANTTSKDKKTSSPSADRKSATSEAWEANTTRPPETAPARVDSASAPRDDYVALQKNEAGDLSKTIANTTVQLEDFSPDRDNGFTIEEIRNASKGFFGTVSANLASVIEYTFKNWGRPSAYILGKEGGGAFLAGLRYGSGNIYPKSGTIEKIYWHGPSLGYDFGAEGSRTMFLVYRLEDTNGMYRRFTGIDGSAYLVGGVGLTFLKGGKVIMAPIRSGLGLRLGANIGYLRFTPRPTWNPF
ncbi:MAG: DUF1134 domain-containing protein [Hyphomicrobiaceae bacterium]